jgi:GntR family transcriptional regulator
LLDLQAKSHIMFDMTSRAHSARLKSAPGVLYHHVAALLRQRIENGEWIPWERLPSIETLAATFNVSVVTLRLALGVLEDERLIKRKHGRGTFVTEKAGQKRWIKLESNWDALIRMWGKSKPRPIKVLDTVGIPTLAAEDGVPAPSYHYMRRVHLADDVPYAIVDIYVDRRIYAVSPRRFDSEMAIVVLDSLPQVKIDRMRQRLTISTADLETAALLDIPVGSPVGIMRRVIQDQHGVAVYIGSAVYRGDLVMLEREVAKP